MNYSLCEKRRRRRQLRFLAERIETSGESMVPERERKDYKLKPAIRRSIVRFQKASLRAGKREGTDSYPEGDQIVDWKPATGLG